MKYSGEKIDVEKYSRDPAYRDQISLFAGLACDPLEDKARQEDKIPSSTDFLLQKFLANPLAVQAGMSGVEDRTAELREVLTVGEDAVKAFDSLPFEMQLKYGTPARFVGAMSRGEYVPPKKEEVKKEEPPKVEEPPKS